MEKITPGFSNSLRFTQAVDLKVAVRGQFIPVGKTRPLSDPANFFLADASKIWDNAHPGKKFGGVLLDTLCVDLVTPYEFEDEKKLPGNPNYLHLVGGVSHAIFTIEEVFDAPRLVIKLYRDPFPGIKHYAGLLGFDPENTAEENAAAANQHIGALIVTLNTALWGSFDGDGVYEFGYGPKNSAPRPVEEFETTRVIVTAP